MMVPITLAAISIGHSPRGVLSRAASDTPVASHRLEVLSVQWGKRIEKLATTKTAAPSSGGSAIWRQFNSSGLERPTPRSPRYSASHYIAHALRLPAWWKYGDGGLATRRCQTRG